MNVSKFIFKARACAPEAAMVVETVEAVKQVANLIQRDIDRELGDTDMKFW